ncbi:MAG: aminomethyl-transferring glycine dehydrogenase subunit GcvPA, partial [Clostridiales bacterium]|nr:aminomethyl-transferring glycine dehydrogenase subunit GcvPA [Clostridiales bacterium]
MHSTIPNTPDDQKEMLSAIGIGSMDALFESVPDEVLLRRGLDLPCGAGEAEVAGRLKALARKGVNTEDLVCFLGAGAYDHFIPAVVDHLLLRQEFYTAYTPYQPEISQGTLQAIFEYQSMICMLTGMDVSNASMYDGASAAAEAVLLACRETRRSATLVARGFSPQGRAVIRTYARFHGVRVDEFGMNGGVCDLADLESRLTKDTACVVVQNPNFFGSVEDLAGIGRLAHENGSLFIVSCDPISLAILKAPGEAGADIAVGEGQPLGLPLSFGGPYLGFFAANEKYLRKMPGRIAGQTVDREGRRGFVLTVQTREQHIRREKATSNICSNQALCALAATIYLAAMGRKGLVEAAALCAQNSRYAYEKLLATGRFKPLWDAPFFKEFALAYKGDTGALNKSLLCCGILGGYDLKRDYPELGNAWLVAVTEKRT